MISHFFTRPFFAHLFLSFYFANILLSLFSARFSFYIASKSVSKREAFLLFSKHLVVWGEKNPAVVGRRIRGSTLISLLV